MNFVNFGSRTPATSDEVFGLTPFRLRQEVQTFLLLTPPPLVTFAAVISFTFLATDGADHTYFILHTLKPKEFFPHALKHQCQFSAHGTSTRLFKSIIVGNCKKVQLGL